MLQQHPGRVAGKNRQAIAARTGEWSAGSSSSSGEEDKKFKKSQEAETEELRAQVERLRRQRGEAARTDRVTQTE